MRPIVFYIQLFSVLIIIFNFGCNQKPASVLGLYNYQLPKYDNIQLLPQKDSLCFPLGDHSYNAIGSFNLFKDKGKSYISFLDRYGQSVITYDFESQRQVHRLPLKKWFPAEKFKKASTFVVNFDSIFIITDKKLFLVDSFSVVKKTIDLYIEQNSKSFSDNETPAVLINNKLYTGIQPVVSQGSLKEHQDWKILCVFDLNNGAKELYYNLPKIYQENLYGYSFLEYCYCVNKDGNFVFSFPADTLIYETNLHDINNIYYAKSSFQTDIIKPISKQVIETGGSRKEYYLRESYGAIYYDSYHKRYLRFAKQKINEADYLAKNRIRKISVIVFDEHFKIIGESLLNNNQGYKTLFFTPDGKIYLRIKGEDEQALHFIRLDYSDIGSTGIKLAQRY